MKVCFETFGCRLNRAESLELEAKFLQRGWTLTERHADADLIVVRGCSVTARAQRDSERLVAHIRAKYPHTRLVATGCLHEKLNERWIADIRDAPDAIPLRTARAYLKIQDGCSGACTFCIVPRFRGKTQSVEFDDVLERARRFIVAGYREIVVTGCNLSLYLSQGRRLPELLDALAALDPACRIRLGSLEPSPVARAVVDVAAAHENVCRFLHVPVQSGSNGILVAMRRPYFTKDVDSLLRDAQSAIPGVAFGCDIMTGFPGETDMDFLATRSLLVRHPFTRVHVFPFSERPGTPAASLHGAVPREVRRARAAEVAKLADTRRTAAAQRFIGKTVEIVVEDEARCAGWTSEYFWCSCPHARAPRKSIVKVHVTGAEKHMLVGSPC